MSVLFVLKSPGSGALRKKKLGCALTRAWRALCKRGRGGNLISWGTPEDPLTRGITLEELQGLDFTKIDLTAAVGEVARVNEKQLTGKVKDSEATTARAQARVTQLTGAEESPYGTYSTVTGKCYTARGTLTHCASITAAP